MLRLDVKVAVDQVRWSRGDECDQQAVIFLQRMERGRQRKGSIDVGNSTDRGNSEKRMDRETLCFWRWSRRGQKEKRGVRELRGWEKGSWKEVKEDRKRSKGEGKAFLWTQSHTENEKGMCSGRENEGMKASRGSEKGRDGRPDGLKRNLTC